ncbi:hypothetical protein MPSEU_000244800 [Mayamaea pseudoterrestris]|nr:hypothetical protein MPSEU_000244800 [Mayamaea pseudoterrestris]
MIVTMMLSTATTRCSKSLLLVARSCPSSNTTTTTIRHFAKAAASKKDSVKPQRQSQKVSTPKKKSVIDSAGGRPNDLQLVLAALDAPMRQEPPLSQEEKDRRHQIGRNYVIGKFRQHNEIHHDLACKLQMKKHAINMLPKNSKLREEALKIDDSGPPTWRNMPVWTPPIPGFDPSQLAGTKDE